MCGLKTALKQLNNWFKAFSTMELFTHAHNYTHIKSLQLRLENFLDTLLAFKPRKKEVELEVVKK